MFKANIKEKNLELVSFIDSLYENNKVQFLVKKYHFTTVEKSKLLCHDILTSLSKTIHSKADFNYVLVPKNTRHYAHKDSLSKYSYKAALLSLDILSFFNLIKIQIGSNKIRVKNKKHLGGTCTKVFLNDVSEWKINIKELFKVYYILKFPVIKKEKIGVFLTNKKYDFSSDRTVKTYEKINSDNKLNIINNFLEKRNYNNFKYKRIYGDSVEKFGRFYNNFQFVRKEERQKLYEKLNWEELDFKAFNPTICYLLEHQPLKEDPYNIILKNLNIPLQDYSIYRPIIKKAFLCLFGCSSKEKALKAIRFQFAHDFGIYIGKNYSITTLDQVENQWIKEDSAFIEKKKFKKRRVNNRKNVFKKFLIKKALPNPTKHYLINPEYLIKIFEESHPLIKKYFYNSKSEILQNIESELICSLMIEQIKNNLLPLTIHDCLILPKSEIPKFKLLIKFHLYKILYHKFNYKQIKEKIKQISILLKKYINNIIIKTTIRIQLRSIKVCFFIDSKAPT